MYVKSVGEERERETKAKYRTEVNYKLNGTHGRLKMATKFLTFFPWRSEVSVPSH